VVIKAIMLRCRFRKIYQEACRSIASLDTRGAINKIGHNNANKTEMTKPIVNSVVIKSFP
jgi:hypothetical protein